MPSNRKNELNRSLRGEMWSQGPLPYLGPLPPISHIATTAWSPLTFFDITSSVPISAALLKLIADTVLIPPILLKLSEKLAAKTFQHRTPVMEHVLQVKSRDKDTFNCIASSLLRKSKRCVLVAFSSAGPPTQFLESVQHQQDAVMEQVCHKASPRLNSATNFPNFNGVQAVCLETYADQALTSFRTHFKGTRNNQSTDMYDSSLFNGSKRIFGGAPRADSYGNPFKDTPPKLGNDMLPCDPSVVLCNSIVYSSASVGCFAIPKILRRKDNSGKMKVSVGGVQVTEVLVLVMPNTDQLTIIAATPRDDSSSLFFEFNLEKIFTKHLPFHTHPTCVALIPSTASELPSNETDFDRVEADPQSKKKKKTLTVNSVLSGKNHGESLLQNQLTLCDWNRCRERCVLLASEIAFEENWLIHKETRQREDERFQNLLDLWRELPLINSSVQFVIGTISGTVITFNLSFSFKSVQEKGTPNSTITNVQVTPLMSVPLYALPITSLAPCLPFFDGNAQPSNMYLTGGLLSLMEARIDYIVEGCSDVTSDAIKKLRGGRIKLCLNDDDDTVTNASGLECINEIKSLRKILQRSVCNQEARDGPSDEKLFYWCNQKSLERTNEVCSLNRRALITPGMVPNCSCSCHVYVETSKRRVVFNSSEPVEPCFECLCNSHDIGMAALEAASLLGDSRDISAAISDVANDSNTSIAVTASVPRRHHMVAVLSNGMLGDVTFFDVCNPWSSSTFLRGIHRIDVPPWSVCTSSTTQSRAFHAESKGKRAFLGFIPCEDEVTGNGMTVFRQEYIPYKIFNIGGSNQYLPYKRWGIHIMSPISVPGRCGVGNRVSEHAVIGHLDSECSIEPSPACKSPKKSGGKRARDTPTSVDKSETSTPVQIKEKVNKTSLLDNSKHFAEFGSGIDISISEAISKLYRNLLPPNSPIHTSSSKCSLVCEMLGVEPNTYIRIPEHELKPLSWMIRWWVILELREGTDRTFSSKLSDAAGRYFHKVIESFGMLSNSLPYLQQLHQLPRCHLGLCITNTGNKPVDKQKPRVDYNEGNFQLLQFFSAFDECLKGPDSSGNWYLPESFLVVNRREMIVVSWGM